MEKPKPRLERVVSGEKELNCPRCGPFIVRDGDSIEFLGYLKFGMLLNIALWSVPCTTCDKPVSFTAHDERNIAIPFCVPCSHCRLFVPLAQTVEEKEAAAGKRIELTCKNCGEKNVLMIRKKG